MDDRGLIGIVFAIVFGLVAASVLAAGIMYANDYEMRATVEDTRCSGTGSEIDVKTKLFGIEHTVREVPLQQCQLMRAGNFVEYRLRTERTTVYQSEGGDCIYDSVTGPGCGALNVL